MSLPDPARVRAIVERVGAELAAPGFRDLKQSDIREKAGGEIVTAIDEAVEAALATALLEETPGAVVVGEEATAANPALLEALAEAPSAWIVDPIDGTANFAAGRPIFAIMLAYWHRGEVVQAWIHDPLGGAMAEAELGGGAWRDGRRLKTAPAPERLEAARGTVHASQFARPELARHLEPLRKRLTQLKSLRCAGHEYLRMLDAESDFSLFTKIMPWDHAPGVLLLREAGGAEATLSGAAYDPSRPREAAMVLGCTAAFTKRLHGFLLADFQPA